MIPRWLAMLLALAGPLSGARAEPTLAEMRVLERVRSDLSRGAALRARAKLEKVLLARGEHAVELWLQWAELSTPCFSDRVLKLSSSQRARDARLWSLFSTLAPPSFSNHPNWSLVMLHRGVFEAESDQWARSHDTLAPVLRRGESSSTQCLRQVAAIAIQHGRLSEAVRALTHARALMPEDPVLPRELGLVLLALGSTQPARQELAAALSAAPESLEVRRDLAYALASDGEPAEAYRMLHAEGPRCARVPECELELAHWALEASELEEAERSMTKFVRAHPDRLEGWLLLGEITSHANEQDRARRAYTEALRISPSSVRAREGLRALGTP